VLGDVGRHLFVVLGDASQDVVHERKPPAGVGLLTQGPLDGRRDVTGETCGASASSMRAKRGVRSASSARAASRPTVRKDS
jgi:hypothetical protein